MSGNLRSQDQSIKEPTLITTGRKLHGNPLSQIPQNGIILNLDINLDKDQLDILLCDSFMLWVEQLNVQFTSDLCDYFVCNGQGKLLQMSTQMESALSISTKQIGQAAEACFKSGKTEILNITADDIILELSIVPIYSITNNLIGMIGIVAAAAETADLAAIIKGLALSFLPYILLQTEKTESQRLLLQKHQIEQESNKRDMLFEVTQKLHSMIDVESVLTEVIERIRELYPFVEVNLFLSQDNQNSSLPIKSLNFTSAEDDICTRAFMEGILIHNVANESHESEIAAPLSAKQGVYGVLHLHSLPEYFDPNDVQFIRLLASTAGSAFENAKLYEQSNFLVNELRLINEITTKLNQSLKLNEIFSFASSELINIFGAEFSCILQMDKTENEMIVQASNLPAMFHEKFSVDYGFSGLVYTTREPVIISDYWSDPKIQSKLMEVTGSRSLIASPILVDGDVVGVILVCHRFPNFFSYENYKLLQVLSGHIGLTIANASLHAEVKRMVITDNLTGLYARHYLDEQVNYFQKKDFCGSLIVVDIDNFKGVNDTFGHQIGDKILIQVSGIIKTCIRDSDIAARWGGEELAIYLPQVSIDQSVRIAERIRNRVLNETNPKVTVSCGVSDWHWEDEKISVELLFYKSDMALYKAKHEGKNQIKIG
jgi:diguanylate cyclase (GGDEF)-like protein